MFFLICIILSISRIAYSQENQTTKQATNFKNKFYSIIGYSANVPKELIGLHLFRLSPKRIGFYIDFKFNSLKNYNKRNDFYENISVNKAENVFSDELINNEKLWISINFAITKVLFNQLAIYAGLGYTESYSYRQYYDSLEILGKYGKYWIEDNNYKDSDINLMSGFFIQIDKAWIFQVGGELYPSGITIGIGYSIF
ncbi:MAG: hypothetical protein Kow0042_19930 [Calditrichia bacterium]